MPESNVGGVVLRLVRCRIEFHICLRIENFDNSTIERFKDVPVSGTFFDSFNVGSKLFRRKLLYYKSAPRIRDIPFNYFL